MENSFDFGAFFDNLGKAAHNFERKFRENAFYNGDFAGDEKDANDFTAGEAGGAYPPANIFRRADGYLVFEFDLAGFCEADIDLSFQNDWMILSAKKDLPQDAEGAPVFLRHDIPFVPVENRRFPVAAAEYRQEAVKAVFKNGLLTVTIPPQPALEPKNKVAIEVL